MKILNEPKRIIVILSWEQFERIVKKLRKSDIIMEFCKDWEADEVHGMTKEEIIDQLYYNEEKDI